MKKPCVSNDNQIFWEKTRLITPPHNTFMKKKSTKASSNMALDNESTPLD
jgi:hypothetical protein